MRLFILAIRRKCREVCTNRRLGHVLVCEHTDHAVHTADVLVYSVEGYDPPAAADLACDVDRRPVGEELQVRGRRVTSSDAKGYGNDDSGFVELGVLEVAVVLWDDS